MLLVDIMLSSTIMHFSGRRERVCTPDGGNKNWLTGNDDGDGDEDGSGGK